MAQIDSSHLCDHYRCALDILGGEESCGQRRMKATILKIIFKSTYFNGLYHCVMVQLG